jgi:hypothetical protein
MGRMEDDRRKKGEGWEEKVGDQTEINDTGVSGEKG